MGKILENTGKRLVSFNLDHATLCKSECLCEKAHVRLQNDNPVTGTRSPHKIARLVPRELTLPVRHKSPAFPDTIIDVLEVKAAIANGDLKVHDAVYPVAKPEPATEPPSPPVEPPTPVPASVPASKKAAAPKAEG